MGAGETPITRRCRVIYWLTRTVHSWARFYYEMRHAPIVFLP